MEFIPITASPSNEAQEPLWRYTFDPQSRFISIWNRFLFVLGILNVGNDCLFFFLPRVNSDNVNIDLRFAFILPSLRMIGDSCQLLGIFVRFRTALEDPGHGVFRSRGLVRDPKIIAKRYLKSTFIIDFVASLPLPQVFLWCNLPSFQTLSTSNSQIRSFVENLALMFIIQYYPRLYALISLRKKITETGGIVVEPAWSGAFYYLLLYITISQFMGAGYYSIYIRKLLECRGVVLEEKGSAAISGWDELLKECAMDDQIEQGMLSDLYKNKIGSRSFLQRYMYCFSWGLKCLSSMGQNFETSASVLETSFSFSMTIFGLVLFAGMIAQMQTSIQYMANGEEQQMVRQIELEEWANNHQLPPDLKKHLQRTVESDWKAIRGQNDETILSLLPSVLQCSIRRHLYFDLACNLPFFANLDRDLVKSFCGYLRTFSCSKGSYVIVEGEPVKQLFFISSGQLEISFVSGGPSDSPLLGAGDLCGLELLAWGSRLSPSNQMLPSASQSVKCLTDVEAFFLSAEVIRLLGIQWNYCWRFQQAMRYQLQ